MLEYIRSKKIEMLVISIWIVVLNAYKIFFRVVGVDTEQALMDFDSNLNWTVGSGRFASAILRKILMPNGFSYDLAVLLIIVGWLAICITYIYCFEQMEITNRWCGIFFSMLFVACPIWAEQSYFVCSIFVNVYGIWLTIIVSYLLVSIQQEFRVDYFIISIIVGVFAIGIYQALLYLLLANCVLFLSLNVYINNGKVRNYLIAGIKCIVIIAVMTALYLVCSEIAVSLFYNSSFDYAGYTDAIQYISNRVKWFDGNILGCVNAIKLYIIYSYKSDYIYGIPSYPVLFALVQLFVVIRFIKKRSGRDIIIFIGNTLLLICAFIGCIILGGAINAREQFVLPLLVSFYSMFLLNEITNVILDYAKFKKALSGLIMITSFYAIMLWGSKQLQINYSDYIRYNADVSYTEKVMNEIAFQVGNYSEKKVVFIGQNQWTLPENYYKSDVIGHSIFSWDTEGPVGVNYRIYGFLKACGYKYIKPTIEEVNEVQDICMTEEIFEDNNCVAVWNDFIVVNLNDL